MFQKNADIQVRYKQIAPILNYLQFLLGFFLLDSRALNYSKMLMRFFYHLINNSAWNTNDEMF